jgi:hypothetical protein
LFREGCDHFAALTHTLTIFQQVLFPLFFAARRFSRRAAKKGSERANIGARLDVPEPDFPAIQPVKAGQPIERLLRDGAAPVAVPPDGFAPTARQFEPVTIMLATTPAV